MKIFLSTSLVVLTLFFSCFSMAADLPSFSLKDALGQTVTDKDISKSGAVLVLTAPILSAKSAQEGWDKYLQEIRAAKPTLVFIEDMQPSDFKSTARKRMQKDYKSGQEPLILIDEDGILRRAFEVDEKKTVVIVLDKDGNKVLQENGKPSEEAAKRIIEAALK